MCIRDRNCADLRTKGWELSITWRDQFKLGGKPFHYALTGQIGDYQTEITKYNNPPKLFDSSYEEMCIRDRSVSPQW